MVISVGSVLFTPGLEPGMLSNPAVVTMLSVMVRQQYFINSDRPARLSRACFSRF